VSRNQKILAFLLLAVVGSLLFFVLAPENFTGNAKGGSGSPTVAIPADAIPAIVNYVHDGDTLFIKTKTDDNLKVRLLGINTPEVGANLECYGDEATQALRDLAPENSTVWVLPDRESFDQYGRSLLYLWQPDGTFINLSLVEQGYAETMFIGDNRKYESEIQSAEDAAKAADIGIWRYC
jgi:micrococcal nuclease